MLPEQSYCRETGKSTYVGRNMHLVQGTGVR